MLKCESDYIRYRGKCKEMSEAACESDKTLRLVRGYYFCPVWGEQQHWWTVKPNGEVYDPTADQFPSRGNGIYEEFDGKVKCESCGKEMMEEDAQFAGRYPVCSTECHMALVL